MVFLSYSHGDQDFVNRLSRELLNKNIKVWRDEYKISPGDSLTSRITAAIDESSLLCVVVSKSSSASQWVQREIEAGLLRESQKQGFSVVPLLAEEVDLPDGLRDRFWIDFRKGFEPGMSELTSFIDRISGIDSSAGTATDGNYSVYYATEEGWVQGIYDLMLDVVSFDREESFCILTCMQFRGNESATEEGLRQRSIASAKAYILRACAQQFAANPGRVKIRADQPAHGTFFLESEDGELRFDARFEVKMLGSHRGETTVFNAGALFGQICSGLGIGTTED